MEVAMVMMMELAVVMKMKVIIVIVMMELGIDWWTVMKMEVVPDDLYSIFHYVHEQLRGVIIMIIYAINTLSKILQYVNSIRLL